MKSGGMGMSSTGGFGFNDGSKSTAVLTLSQFTIRINPIRDGNTTDNRPLKRQVI